MVKKSSTYAIAGIFERQNIREKRVHLSFEIISSFFLIPFLFQSGSDKSHVILVKNSDDDIFGVVDNRITVFINSAFRFEEFWIFFNVSAIVVFVKWLVVRHLNLKNVVKEVRKGRQTFNGCHSKEIIAVYIWYLLERLQVELHKRIFWV